MEHDHDATELYIDHSENKTEKPSEEQEIILHTEKENQHEEIQQKPSSETPESTVGKDQERPEETNQTQTSEQKQEAEQPQESAQIVPPQEIEEETKQQEPNQNDAVMDNIQSMLGGYPLPNEQVTNMSPITPNTQE